MPASQPGTAALNGILSKHRGGVLTAAIVAEMREAIGPYLSQEKEREGADEVTRTIQGKRVAQDQGIIDELRRRCAAFEEERDAAVERHQQGVDQLSRRYAAAKKVAKEREQKIDELSRRCAALEERAAAEKVAKEREQKKQDAAEGSGRGFLHAAATQLVKVCLTHARTRLRTLALTYSLTHSLTYALIMSGSRSRTRRRARAR